METLSIVIPAWSVVPGLTQMLSDLCKKVVVMCDQLVVTEDGNYSRKIEEVADTYLHHHRLGHSGNLGLGLMACTGDFIAILDSDVMISLGDIRDLVIPGTVVSPTWVDHPANNTINGWFMVGPRETFFPVPPISEVEGIDLWCNDIWQRNRATFVYSDKVEYSHNRNTSYTHYSAFA